MMAWLLVYLLHSTLIYALTRLLRSRTRDIGSAQALLRTALVVPVVSAALATFSGAGIWTLALLPRAQSATDAARPALAGVSADAIAAALFFAIGACLTLRDVVARRLFVSGLDRREVRDGLALRAFARVVDGANVSRRIRLTSSRRLACPVAVSSREICIPLRAASDLGDRELRALLAHELRHLLRRDPLWFRVLALFETLLFVQPLHRRVCRELRRLAELDCDRWAANQIGDARAMAACLVKVASWARGSAPSGIAAMARGGLSERVEALVTDAAATRPPAMRHAWALPLIVAAMLLPSVRARDLAQPPERRSAEYQAGFALGQRFLAESGGQRLTQEEAFRAGYEAGLRGVR